MEFEAPYQFPFPLDQLSWDFQLFAGSPVDSNGEARAADKEGRRTLLIGTKHTAAQRFLEPFQRLNLRVDVQTDFVGLHNLLVYEHFRADNSSAAVAAIDVGCDVTNIVVSSPYSLWHHTCGVAGQTFTRTGQGVQPQPGSGRATQAGPRVAGTSERSLRSAGAGARRAAQGNARGSGGLCPGPGGSSAAAGRGTWRRALAARPTALFCLRPLTSGSKRGARLPARHLAPMMPRFDSRNRSRSWFESWVLGGQAED